MLDTITPAGAIDECINEGILAEFFRDRRTEVLEMAVLDFTFERREKLIERDSREEGIELGKTLVAENMLKAGRPVEEIQNFTGLSVDTIMKIANEPEGCMSQM
ncbi:MAG: hypothetical protein ACI4GD_11515 [Lachnospiraceae bacterium]